MEEQVQDGSLTIRPMMPAERKRWPKLNNDERAACRRPRRGRSPPSLAALRLGRPPTGTSPHEEECPTRRAVIRRLNWLAETTPFGRRRHAQRGYGTAHRTALPGGPVRRHTRPRVRDRVEDGHSVRVDGEVAQRRGGRRPSSLLEGARGVAVSRTVRGGRGPCPGARVVCGGRGRLRSRSCPGPSVWPARPGVGRVPCRAACRA